MPLLVAFDGVGLEIVVPFAWQSGVATGDREYLEELMTDWQGMAADEIPGLLQQLSELSIGPLRAVESGVLDSRKRDRLLGHIRSGLPTGEGPG